MKRAALLLVLAAACSSSPGTAVDGGITRRGGTPPIASAADAAGASSASDAQAPPPADAGAPPSPVVDAAAMDAKNLSSLDTMDVEALPVCGSIILDRTDAGMTNSCRGRSWNGRPCLRCVGTTEAAPPCRVEGMVLCGTRVNEVVPALCVPSCDWCPPHFGGHTCPVDGGT